MKTVKVRITFTRECYGINPNNPAIRTEFEAQRAKKYSTSAKKQKEMLEEVLPKIPEEQEMFNLEENISDQIDKGTTVFARTKDGLPAMFDYQWKGFFKEKTKALRGLEDSVASTAANWTAGVEQYVWIGERIQAIHLPLDENGEQMTTWINERPIRIDDKGQVRTALASSEVVPEGSWLDLTIKCIKPGWMAIVKECLDYGEIFGTGSRRSDGFGTFTYEILEVDMYCTPAELKALKSKKEQAAG